MDTQDSNTELEQGTTEATGDGVSPLTQVRFSAPPQGSLVTLSQVVVKELDVVYNLVVEGGNATLQELLEKVVVPDLNKIPYEDAWATTPGKHVLKLHLQLVRELEDNES